MNHDRNFDFLTGGLVSESTAPGAIFFEDMDWTIDFDARDVPLRDPGIPCPGVTGAAPDPDGEAIPSWPLPGNMGFDMNPPLNSSGALFEQQGGTGPPPNQNLGSIMAVSNEAMEWNALGTASSNANSRRPKVRNPPDAVWAAQKASISKLYLEEDKTLEETRKTMVEDFSFDAT